MRRPSDGDADVVTKFVVTYWVTSGWSEAITCEAKSPNHAASVSRLQLRAERGQVAARQAVIDGIAALQG